MKRFMWATAALTLAGCNNVETALKVVGPSVPSDEMKCIFPAMGMDYELNLYYDAVQSDTFVLFLRVVNTLTTQVVNLGPDQRHDDFTYANAVNPRSMEIRWECDTNGFAANVGPLYLPQFSATQPFCLNQSTKDFVGFDVIPASGQAIDPGLGMGIVQIRPITPQLGDAILDMFNFARDAQACCTEAGGCQTDADLQRASSGPACTRLQTEFDQIAGSGRLRNTSAADLQKFIPYEKYDERGMPPPKPLQKLRPAYPLRLRGVLEGVTGTGHIVGSNEYTDTINICAGCASAPYVCSAL